jgi:lipoprotein-anchoring transpeptidase ErfK/SrfK
MFWGAHGDRSGEFGSMASQVVLRREIRANVRVDGKPDDYYSGFRGMSPQFERMERDALAWVSQRSVRHDHTHGIAKGVPVRPASSRVRAVAFALAVVGLLLSTSASPLVAQEWAPPRTVWVEDAGHTIDGYFLDLWRSYPSLLGQPITEEWESPIEIDGFGRADRFVQYFEHMAIVYVPEGADKNEQVQVLRLGLEAYERDSAELVKQTLPDSGTCGTMPSTACRSFEETGHTVRNGMLEFWEKHEGERLIGAPLTEEFVAKDGYTTQYFEKMVLRWKEGLAITPRSVGSESASAQKLPTEKIPQPNATPVYEESLFVEPQIDPSQVIPGGEAVQGVGAMDAGPGPQQGALKEIVISVGRQSLWAYENGKLVTATLVSTGTAEVTETKTPVGQYTILTKYQKQTMQGVINNEPYKVEDVPWVMYFDNLGNAIHGTYWHENFGKPMSHGCVNLPLDVAQYLYTWAPEGTAVTIIP